MMKPLLMLVMGLLLLGCDGCDDKWRQTYYEERGWVRQVWTGKWTGSGLETYYITFERELPKGEIVQLLIRDSGAPVIWQGEHVCLKLKKNEIGCEQSYYAKLNLIEAVRLD